MRIVVTFALENEFGPWRSMHKFRSAKWGTAEIYVAEIGGAEIEVLLTGAGAQAARRFAALMSSEYDSTNACISAGLAGALKEEYGVGQVLAASRVVSEDRVIDERPAVLRSSGALVSFASDCGATVVNRFFTAGRIIISADDKRQLGEVADAVEMESFEILNEAAAYGIPAVAIRAVSDTVRQDLPLDLNQIFTHKGQVSVPRVLGQVTLHPGSVPGLVKLGQQSKRAAESLAQFLDRYVATLAERARNLEPKAAAL